MVAWFPFFRVAIFPALSTDRRAACATSADLPLTIAPAWTADSVWRNEDSASPGFNLCEVMVVPDGALERGEVSGLDSASCDSESCAKGDITWWIPLRGKPMPGPAVGALCSLYCPRGFPDRAAMTGEGFSIDLGFGGRLSVNGLPSPPKWRWRSLSGEASSATRWLAVRSGELVTADTLASDALCTGFPHVNSSSLPDVDRRPGDTCLTDGDEPSADESLSAELCPIAMWGETLWATNVACAGSGGSVKSKRRATRWEESGVAATGLRGNVVEGWNGLEDALAVWLLLIFLSRICGDDTAAGDVAGYSSDATVGGWSASWYPPRPWPFNSTAVNCGFCHRRLWLDALPPDILVSPPDSKSAGGALWVCSCVTSRDWWWGGLIPLGEPVWNSVPELSLCTNDCLCNEFRTGDAVLARDDTSSVAPATCHVRCMAMVSRPSRDALTPATVCWARELLLLCSADFPDWESVVVAAAEGGVSLALQVGAWLLRPWGAP